MEVRTICVAGIGAVGGLLASMLGKIYGKQLTVYARPGKADLIKRNGLVLHSEFYGDVHAVPGRVCEKAEEIGPQDYLFICVKNYSLMTLAEEIRPAVNANTVIIPVMNGVEAGDRLRTFFPEANVCDSVIYTISGANPDGSVTQSGQYTHLFIGSKIRDDRHQAGARSACQLLQKTGFDVRWSDDIELEIWQKFILNCAFNTLTARHQITTGVIRESETLKQDLLALLSEAYQAGRAEGIAVPSDFVKQKYDYVIYHQPLGGTSSMKRDVDAKRPTELDAFSGTVLRLAEKHGLEVPVTLQYHEALMQINARNSAGI